MSDLDLDLIARVAHEAVAAYRRGLGEAALPAWDDAAEWMRASTRDSVRFCLANPSAPASALHDAWMAQKAADGWRAGPTRDDAAKIHPMMRPFAELPITEQRKDLLIQAVVGALGASA